MPFFNKRQKIAKSINRNAAGGFGPTVEVTESPEVNDFALLQGLTETVKQEQNNVKWLIHTQSNGITK